MFMGFFSLANAVTLFGLISALTSCFLAANGNVKFAVYMLFLTTICDAFSGVVIRATSNQSPKHKQFALQLSSICDLVCFGVTPCFIAFSFGLKSWIDIIIYCVYIACAAIRTAHFKALKTAFPNKKIKTDLGVPLSASTYLLTLLFLFTTFMPIALTAWLFRLSLLALSVAFIIKIRIKRPVLNQLAMALGIELVVLFILLLAGDCKAPENDVVTDETSIVETSSEESK